MFQTVCKRRRWFPAHLMTVKQSVGSEQGQGELWKDVSMFPRPDGPHMRMSLMTCLARPISL